MIDERAIIDPSARIAANVTIGAWSVIGPGVEIGEGSQLDPHVVIQKNTKIGRNNKIASFAVLGGDPQSLQFKDEPVYLEIGDDNIIREFCTLNRGTAQGNVTTKVGSRNYFMAYAHVAHDCEIGNDNIFANNASVAGHVKVEDFVTFSAFCGAHQFVTIGSYSFLGRATKVGQDIPPYVLVTGVPGAPCGLNLVGLKRRGFSDETVRQLRRAYFIVYRKGLKLKDAVAELEGMIEQCPEVRPFIDALTQSKRGIAR